MKMKGKNKGYYKSEDENYETSWSSSPVLYRHKNIDASTLSCYSKSRMSTLLDIFYRSQ